MRLWICEKPSAGRALAAQLPKPHKNINGAIEVDGGKQIVTWCVGHLLSTLEPQEYDEKYKRWNKASLPIIPSTWKLKPNDNVKGQLKVVKDLLGKAKEIVHAGDTDREGQLLVDELFTYFKINKPIKRCLLNSMEAKDIKKAIKGISDNANFQSLSHSALGRQRADWLVGMNCSRMATLSAQEKGYQGVITVGRVQTPTLALIVKRDEEIQNFVPATYFNIYATFEKKGVLFESQWIPKGSSLQELSSLENLNKKEDIDENLEDEENEDSNNNKKSFKLPSWLDKNKRIIDETIAQQIVEKVKKESHGKVVEYKKERKTETRPKLFSLSLLQSEMGKHGFSPDETLEVTQSLYDKGFLTYPRSDSNFLPPNAKENVKEILSNLSFLEDFSPFYESADPDIKTKIWNAKETEVHHAIVPTVKKPLIGSFSDKELKLYLEVAKRYFITFMPECVYDNAQIKIDIADETFSLSSKVIIEEGWKAFKGKVVNSNSEEKELPKIDEGEDLPLNKVDYKNLQTSPPPLFQEAKLPLIMKEIYKQIDDKETRKKLKETNGIGTEATRSNIIKELFRRKLIRIENKKYVTATDLGRAIIQSLPEKLTSFVLTAQWENLLTQIYKKQISLKEFEERQENFIKGIMGLIEDSNYQEIAKLSPSQKTTYNNKPLESKGECPKCGGVLVERVAKSGPNKGKKFIGCSNFAKNGCKYVKNLD